MKKNRLIALAACLILTLGCLTGCSQPAASVEETTAVELSDSGTLYLMVNPDIAVHYDGQGNVTGLTARNEEAKAILAGFTGWEGRECRLVVSDLVKAIGDAGYFVEEVEGEPRQVTIEIESGSVLPHDLFLEDVIEEIRQCIGQNQWHSPVNVRGESDYGWSDYADTDYGPGNDGNTDYAGSTDYDSNTDYGPNNDGHTDYSDYGTTAQPSAPSHGGSDYGSSGYSDYQSGTVTVPTQSAKPSAPSNGNSGYSDYGNSGYGNSGYGNSGYSDYQSGTVTVPAQPSAPSNGNSDYSDYGNSGYGNSGYSDYRSATVTVPTQPSVPSTPSYGDSGYSDYGSSGYSAYGNSGYSDYDSDSGYGAS